MSRGAFEERLAAARGAYHALRHPGPAPAFEPARTRRAVRRRPLLAAAGLAVLALAVALWRMPGPVTPDAAPPAWPETLRPVVRSVSPASPPWPAAPGALAGAGEGFRLPAPPHRRHCFGRDEACPPLG